jgi:hypothetical protein
MTPEPAPARPEVDGLSECNWARCHRSPNPCFAWCKCRCHNRAARAGESPDAAGLTKAEREAIDRAVFEHDYTYPPPLHAAVERIVAARVSEVLAPVRALAEEWAAPPWYPIPRPEAAGQLLAVLRADHAPTPDREA